MKIAIIGAGAIGGLVAGYLKLKGEDVSLVGHPDSVRAIKENGVQISGAIGNFSVKINVSEKLNYKPDLIILATKTQDIDSALKADTNFIKESLVLTTQNGMQADTFSARYVPRKNIISSIVMFGATSLEPGEVVHNFEGNWIIGKVFGGSDEKLTTISGIINKIFPVVVAEDITSMKYLKVFVNANNCIAAILGVSMQEAFCDIDISRIGINIWKEGLGVVKRAGINLVSLPDFPLERLTKLVSLPTSESAKIFSGIMNSLSKEPLYGSILQSIKRGRLSEIDYINGEFVSLAQRSGVNAPLNKKLVEMVHQVEKTKRFFTKEELIFATKATS